MTVSSLQNHGFKPLALPCGDREISGVYIGDLLSWVMSHAKTDNAWITVMSNINVIAVASLVDVSCVIIADEDVLTEDVIAVAKEKNINILSTTSPIYETAVAISELL